MYRKALTSDSLSTHGFFWGKNFPSPPLSELFVAITQPAAAAAASKRSTNPRVAPNA